VTGSSDSVSLAKQMIEELLQEEGGRRGGDWDGQRGGGFGGGFGGGQQRSWGSGGGFDGGSQADSITVDSGMVGRIIGKRGARVRELQDMSGCNINVPRDRGYGADVRIELSGDLQAISKAKRLIKEVVAEDQYSGGRGDGSGRGGGFGGGFGDSQGGRSITVEVDNNLIGKIIGKAGSKIKDMQEQSGARINVPRDRGSSPIVPITISGGEESIQIAKQLIEEIIGEGPGYSGGYGSRGGFDQNGAEDMDVSGGRMGRVIGN